MIGPPPAKRGILGQVECLRRFVIEITHLLVQLKHGQSELTVRNPGRRIRASRGHIKHLGQLAINLELQITLDGYILD